VIIFGHGDDREGNRINTLASIEAVRRSGSDGLECDVRRTADNVVVVTHDHELPDGRLLPATLARDLPPHIPTLLTLLDHSEGLLVNIEVKNFPRDPAFDSSEKVTELTVDLLAQREYRDSVLISSFGSGCLDRVRAMAPNLSTAMLYLSRRPVDDLLNEVVRHGHRIVHPYDTMVNDEFMIGARRRSLSVNVWVDQLTDERLGQLIELAVDGIITHEYERVLRAVGR